MVLAVIVTAGGVAAVVPSGAAPDLSKILASANCQIKGNVSQNTGERIYHVPGQKFYSETVIRSEYGERWFCTEAEAQQAGWRKARR